MLRYVGLTIIISAVAGFATAEVIRRVELQREASRRKSMQLSDLELNQEPAVPLYTMSSESVLLNLEEFPFLLDLPNVNQENGLKQISIGDLTSSVLDTECSSSSHYGNLCVNHPECDQPCCQYSPQVSKLEPC